MITSDKIDGRQPMDRSASFLARPGRRCTRSANYKKYRPVRQGDNFDFDLLFRLFSPATIPNDKNRSRDFDCGTTKWLRVQHQSCVS